ncbi:hypothetical protein KY345_01750 [Candidatus Woesearchaeota archaeon]|nr:hypothetical protein [Candidatus Woesearchaeota archaeon]
MKDKKKEEKEKIIPFRTKGEQPKPMPEVPLGKFLAEHDIGYKNPPDNTLYDPDLKPHKPEDNSQ